MVAHRALVGLLPISVRVGSEPLHAKAHSRISLRGRAIGMSDEYRGTVGERVLR
jgi:hypothetical protein